MAVDNLVGVVVEVAEGDEAAPLAGFGCTWNDVGLGVAIDGGHGFFGEDALAAPVVEVLGCAGVDVILVVVAGLVFAKNDTDEVVGAGLVVTLLHGGGDLVVGLSDDSLQIDAGGVVTEGAERVKASHAFSVLQTSKVWNDCTGCGVNATFRPAGAYGVKWRMWARKGKAPRDKSVTTGLTPESIIFLIRHLMGCRLRHLRVRMIDQ